MFEFFFGLIWALILCVLFSSLFIFLISFFLFAQNNVETYQLSIKKINEKISLDGILDEPFWEDVEIASDFWMNFPDDGITVADEYQTLVKVAYDDDFIFFGVQCLGKGPFLNL